MHCRTGWLPGSAGRTGGVEGELPPTSGNVTVPAITGYLLALLAQIQSTVGEAINSRVGRDRVAVVLGTSTSGLDEGDVHVRHKPQR